MDNNAAKSEKSHLIHEKDAKMYSLKLQRWEKCHVSLCAAADAGAWRMMCAGYSLKGLHPNQ